jgi:hypothetical protein
LEWSEDFSSTKGWSSGNAGGSTTTYTANYGVAPDGTTTADRIQLALNGGPYADWLKVNVLTVGQTYTYSIYLKSLTSNCTIYFLSDWSANILKNVTTEWVRYTHTFTATEIYYIPRFLITAETSTSADILAWGAQLELGSYSTSYIPTASASVTRNADVISKTGISSLIGQTEGTIFFDIQTVNTANIKAISISSVDFNNYMYYYESNNNYYFIIVSGGVALTLPFSGQTLPSRKKIALRYSQNNFSMWINGVKRVEKLEVFNPPSGLNKMQFMNPFNQLNTVLDSKINSVLLFKTALSNTELSQLTTI